MKIDHYQNEEVFYNKKETKALLVQVVVVLHHLHNLVESYHNHLMEYYYNQLVADCN